MIFAHHQSHLSRTSSLAGRIAIGLALTLIPTSGIAKVGVTSAVNQAAESAPPGGRVRVLSLGKSLVQDERITTGSDGLVQVLLLDGTTLTVAPGTTFVIDRFAYDSDKGEASLSTTLVNGAFRFVGGLASKKAGGVTVQTAVGTMGIRGAMVEISSRRGGETLASMIFGDEVVFTANNGKRTRIYEPGYTMEINEQGQRTRVRRRTKEDAQTFQTALAGKLGKKGGAQRGPTDPEVATSELASINSNAPDRVTLPTPRPNPVQSSTIEEAEDQIAQIETVATQSVRVTLPTARPETEPQVSYDPDQDPALQQLRLRTAAATFVSSFNSNEAIGNAGERGLIGGPQNDQTLDFIQTGGRILDANGGSTVNIPDATGTLGDTGLEAIAVTDALLNGASYSGIAYGGFGDFATYHLFRNGDIDQPATLITGTPTDTAGLQAFETGQDIRTYSIMPDAARPSALPYFREDLYGAPQNFADTQLKVIEGGSNANIRSMQHWIDISGTGTAQKSAVLVFAGNFFTGFLDQDDDDALKLYTSLRGGYRTQSDLGNIRIAGGIGTIAGADGQHVFGDNAEHFVISSPNGEGYNDTYYDGVQEQDNFADFDRTGTYSDSGHFSTFHTAALVNETPQASFSRTTRNHQGFAVGLMETSTEGTDLSNAFALFAGTSAAGSLTNGGPNMSLNINAANNTVNGQITGTDVFDANPFVAEYLMSYGSIGSSFGGSAFVDDNTFAATNTRDSSLTTLTNDSSAVLPVTEDEYPDTYIVSGRAAPLPGFEHCTACNFADWGWWGTATRVPNDGTITASGTEDRRDRVHLGTWVAGDITNAADLPSTPGLVTYSGTALGSVVEFNSSNQTYIAQGTANMSFDFATRSGTMTIGFGGMTGTGGVNQITGPVQALFGGTLGGSSVSGSVSGAFVNDGTDIAKGALGQFQLENGSRTGFGTFLTSR